MIIVIYNCKVSYALGDLMELSRLLKDMGIEFNAKNEEISVGDDIVVVFRLGQVEKTAGMRFNYFVVGYGSGCYAREFLMQSASKTGGKELENVYEVAKVIEEKIKENKDE